MTAWTSGGASTGASDQVSASSTSRPAASAVASSLASTLRDDACRRPTSSPTRTRKSMPTAEVDARPPCAAGPRRRPRPRGRSPRRRRPRASRRARRGPRGRPARRGAARGRRRSADRRPGPRRSAGSARAPHRSRAPCAPARCRARRPSARPAQRGHVAGEGEADVGEAAGAVAAQDLDRLAHLARVADGVGQRLAHVGDQRAGRAAAVLAERDAQLGQLARGVEVLHERARAGLDVEQDRVGAAGQLLAHDARGDQRDVVDRRGDVAQRVHRLVGRHEVGRLRAHREADRLDLRDQLVAGELGAHAGDRVELVERAAGVAEPAAGELDHLHAELGRERGDDERGAVADAAGRVLVDGRAGQPREVELVARGDHRGGQRDRLGAREAVEVAGHQEGGHLVVGDVVAGVGEHELAQGLGGQLLAVALGGDHVDRPHAGIPCHSMARSRDDGHLRARVEALDRRRPRPRGAGGAARAARRAARRTSSRARFAHGLSFGTAGLRGRLGAGPSRMNVATVRSASAGLARYLLDAVEGARDGGRRGRPRRAPRLRALRGGGGRRVLRRRAAHATALPPLAPTPLLAFAVRQLGCAAGVMVTASHNPPQDNGYKVYLGDGAQIAPPADEQIAAAIDARRPARRRCRSATAASAVRRRRGLPGGHPRRAPAARARATLRIVYTPLHGVGAPPVPGGARARRLRARRTSSRSRPSPIPTSRPSPRPNPEEPGTLDLALAAAARAGRRRGARQRPRRRPARRRDPRARAAGAACTATRSARCCADFLLEHCEDPRRALLVTTVASSTLLGRMAEAAGARLRRDAHRLQVDDARRRRARRSSGCCSATRRRSATRSPTSCATRTASRPRS